MIKWGDHTLPCDAITARCTICKEIIIKNENTNARYYQFYSWFTLSCMYIVFAIEHTRFWIQNGCCYIDTINSINSSIWNAVWINYANVCFGCSSSGHTTAVSGKHGAHGWQAIDVGDIDLVQGRLHYPLDQSSQVRVGLLVISTTVTIQWTLHLAYMICTKGCACTRHSIPRSRPRRSTSKPRVRDHIPILETTALLGTF